MKYLLLLFLSNGNIQQHYVQIPYTEVNTLSLDACNYVGLSMVLDKRNKVTDYECKVVNIVSNLVVLKK